MNKEGRGYINAPEFNLLAHKAQMDIFENTFHDYKMAMLKPSNHTKLADELDMIREKIATYKQVGKQLNKNSTDSSEGIITTDVHWLESVYEESGSSTRSISLTPPRGADIVDAGNTANTRIILRAFYDGSGSKQEGVGDYIIYLDKAQGSPLASSLVSTTPGALIISCGSTDASSVVGQTIAKHINDFSPYHSAEVVDSTTGKITITYLQDASLINGSESVGAFGQGSIDSLPFITTSSEHRYFEEVDAQDWIYITNGGGKIKPTTSRPVFYRKSKTKIGVYPDLTKHIKHDYIARPASPKWVGIESNGNFIYSSSASTDFDLHDSEEGTLVNKILELAGVVIGSPEITQAAIENEQLNEADKNN